MGEPKQRRSVGVKERQAALAFAEKMAQISTEAPNADCKKIFYDAINTIRRRYGFKDPEKRAIILKYIEVGASTVDDLEMETKFERAEILYFLDVLVTEGKLQKVMDLNGGFYQIETDEYADKC